MAVADATGAAAPAAARGGGRLIGALIGLAAVALTVALFISLGNIGLGLAPTAVLVLAAVPVFAIGAGAVRHISGRDRQEHKEYPLGLSAPSFRVPLEGGDIDTVIHVQTLWSCEALNGMPPPGLVARAGSRSSDGYAIRSFRQFFRTVESCF